MLRAKQGNSVLLPCHVTNLDNFVVMWKQANRVLSAGNLIVRKDPRMSLRDDYSLEIIDVTPDDQGLYTCEIDIMGKPISIQHTVRMLVPIGKQYSKIEASHSLPKAVSICRHCRHFFYLGTFLSKTILMTFLLICASLASKILPREKSATVQSHNKIL